MTPAALRALAFRVEAEEPTEELRAAVLTAFGSEADPGAEPDPLRSVDDAIGFTPARWFPVVTLGESGVWRCSFHRDGGQSVRARSKTLAQMWTTAALRALAWEKGNAG